MQVKVHLARALREHAGGQADVDVAVADGQSPTVSAVLGGLAAVHPGVGRRVRDERGQVRQHVNVFLNGEKAAGDAAVAEGDEIVILPAVSGG